RPNILFVNTDSKAQHDLQEMMTVARSAQMGVALMVVHQVARLGRERALTVWVRDQSPHWELGLRLANLDLSLLLGYQLARNWGAKLRLRTVVEQERNLKDAETFLHRIIRDARLPDGEVSVVHGTFAEALESAGDTDLNIFGLPETL